MICVRADEAIRTDLGSTPPGLRTLLRHGIRFDDGTAWTERHRRELEREDHHAAPRLALGHRRRPARCLRGVDTLTAVGLCSEIGDFQRFAHPEQLMSYLGLGPL